MHKRMPWLVGLAILLLGLLAPIPAGAHSGPMIGAYVTLTPSKPQPGQPVQLDLEVLDPQGTPVSQLRLGATVVTAAKEKTGAPAQILNEAGPGKYRGSISFPADGTYGIFLQADVSGEVWQGEVPVVIGPGAIPVTAAGVALMADDEHAGEEEAGFPWLWVLTGGAVLMFGGAFWLVLRSGPRRHQG